MSIVQKPIRCGDTVTHKPSGESWLVAYADYVSGYLAWFGYPDGEARIEDCELVKSCSDEEHAKEVSEWLDKPHSRDSYGCENRRVVNVRRLYRPEEQRRMNGEMRTKRIAELEAELVKLRAEEVETTLPALEEP